MKEKEKPIDVPIKRDTFHEFCLNLFNSVARAGNRMQKREIQVLAAYMRKHDNQPDVPLTSTETRREIREQLGINEQNMNNILAKLKKKGQFVDGKFKWFLRYNEIERIIFDLKK